MYAATLHGKGPAWTQIVTLSSTCSPAPSLATNAGGTWEWEEPLPFQFQPPLKCPFALSELSREMGRAGDGGPGQPAVRRVPLPGAGPGSAPRTAACPALPAGSAAPHGTRDQAWAGRHWGHAPLPRMALPASCKTRSARGQDGMMFLRMLRPAFWARCCKIHLGFVCPSQTKDRRNRELPSALPWTKGNHSAVVVSGEQNFVALSLSSLVRKETKAIQDWGAWPSQDQVNGTSENAPSAQGEQRDHLLCGPARWLSQGFQHIVTWDMKIWVLLPRNMFVDVKGSHALTGTKLKPLWACLSSCENDVTLGFLRPCFTEDKTVTEISSNRGA